VKLSELGEDGFLNELALRFPPDTERIPVGIGDDAAVVAPLDGERLLLATDSLVETVHFTRQSLPPRFAGRKAVAVNASDIAAMGGVAQAVLLSLSVPEETEVESLWQLVEGAAERARELGMELVGGNLARSPGPVVIDVTILGSTIHGRALLRKGARVGDAIYVSGKLGAAATGFELIRRGAALSPSGLVVPDALGTGPLRLAEGCIRSHIDPQPRLELGRLLNERRVATSCMDISDGLGADLPRLCRASGVGARIEESALPLDPGLLAWEHAWGNKPLARALGGGEDYELLFTVRNEKKLESLRKKVTLPLTRIGVLGEPDGPLEIRRRDGRLETLERGGWDHFRAPVVG
jgi:thiamine-monophosphate kinase